MVSGVSWDGRIAAHCTAVPDVAEGKALYSVFCSLPASLVRHLERGVECRGELGKRSEVGAEGGARSLSGWQWGCVLDACVIPIRAPCTAGGGGAGEACLACMGEGTYAVGACESEG